MSLDIDGLLPENSHRKICVAVEDENAATGECGVTLVFPKEIAGRLSEEELRLAALYLAARIINDHSAWAAYHLYALRIGKELSRDFVEQLLREVKTHPLIPRPTDMVAYWRGKARALTVLLRLCYEQLKFG